MFAPATRIYCRKMTLLCTFAQFLLIVVIVGNSKSVTDFTYTPYHMDLRGPLRAFDKCLVHIAQAQIEDQVRFVIYNL